jgi:hypothetical protein
VISWSIQMPELARGPWRAVCWALCLSAAIATFATSPHSIISLAVFFAICLAVLYSIDRQVAAADACGVFSFYVLATLALYWTQSWALPQYHGFSGGPGVGTDDSFFFSIGSPVLPEGLPVRVNYFVSDHPYGMLLRLFSGPMYQLYGTVHPLDLLFLNAAGLAPMPFLVLKTARLITGEEQTARLAFVLSLVCPFTLANGVILIRDGLMATLFIGSLYGLVSRRFVLMSVMLLAAAILRLPHAIMFVASLWMISLFARYGGRPLPGVWRPGWLSAGALLIAPFAVALTTYLYFGAALLDRLSAVEGLFRESFLNEFVLNQALADQGTATFYAINQLALPVRLPLAFLFYFGAPHLALDTLVISGSLIPRQVLTALFALAFIVYVGWFVRGVMRAWDAANALLLGCILTYCVDLLILSQASMQVRHKVALLPLFYIVVAYGLRYRQQDAVFVGLVTCFGVGAVELLFNAYKLWIL